MDKEIKRVYCLVCLDLITSKELFDMVNISKKLTNISANRLKRNGVYAIPEKLQGIGGGFGDVSIWHTIKSLLETAQLLLIPIAITRTISQKYRLRKINKAQKLRPKIDINLSIRLKNKYQKDYVVYALGPAMINLKYLADDLTSFLENEFPLFLYNQIVSLSFNHFSCRVTVNLQHSQLNKKNTSKIVDHLNNLQIKKNTEVWISVSKFGLIKEVRNRTECEEGAWSSKPNRSIFSNSYFFH